MPVDVQKHISEIEKAVSSSAELMRKIYGPAWDAQGDLAKILITVSSALLAAFLAFSSEVFEGLSDPLVCLALICAGGMLLTLGFCIISLYAATEMSSFQARQFNRRPAIRQRLAQLDENATDFDDQVERIWKPMLDEDLKPVGTAADQSKFFLTSGVFLFISSLLGFMIFVGIRYGRT